MSETFEHVLGYMTAHESGDAEEAYFDRAAWRELIVRLRAAHEREVATLKAAPELYECLRDAVEDMEEINCDPDGCSSCLLRDDCKIQKYRYVLAKASGEEVAK